ncbi:MULTISPECIES: histidine--tRNA ligase [Bradyrhizobium]|jgi:histidyl-tRNA synthetase|uniref:Histidine--tRNA ligase n=1 Tax=Bradyrhizobium japonicum TaxID=375 RepID=A0A1Y2JFP0_BRAJP|nr:MULTISPECIES: histidine--tRNA ligase [Bradyrhizobium]OSJ27511.1 histidine--tRNA ligase [Bradyrhizobium japonicum]TFW57194.1 histidine--tRNA ligase [Bradyrhizobium sp. MOS001]
MAEKPKKPQKLKARLPRGLEDRDPAAIRATREMVEKIRTVYELYGFEPVETPAMEYTDALGKFLPDQDRPNEGVFSFQDDDEQWISLRYDLTAPLARYVGERYGTDGLVLPYRSYRVGYVFRNEKPGPGRFRQFMQFDADTVGSATPAADAEMCMMAADTMEALGVPRGSYVVKINSRKIFDGVLESIGLGGEENAVRRLTVLRTIDKLDKFSTDDIRKLLGPGRWDGGEEGKGDFTKGAGLTPDQMEIVFRVAGGHNESWVRVDSDNQPYEDDWCLSPAQFKQHLSDNQAWAADDGAPGYFFSNDTLLTNWRPLLNSPTGLQGLEELEQICSILTSAGYGSQRIRIASEVVRGLEYYTGSVLEVELLLETKDEKGRPVRFGSVGGGGRYDGLVSRFRGEPVPATGFSIGVSRLQAALTLLGKLDTRPEFGPVVVTVFDRDRVADYQKMVASLRAAGIRAELYLGNPKNMGNQLKYADRRNSPCVIIQGSDEKARGELQIKDLIEGAKAAAAIASNQEWRESRPAQFSCSEADLVAKVREVLGRHDVKWG